MDSLISSLNESGWDGVFFIIDELSEFLKSKPSVQQLNEDTRFLQFIGEASANMPIWIVAALQETIERTGEIAPDVFKKIKDRYHQRLRLTTRHLHELVSKRLIRRKNKNAVQVIESLFDAIDGLYYVLFGLSECYCGDLRGFFFYKKFFKSSQKRFENRFHVL